ncbi:hypothetical protein ACX1C1_03980 [Paenibacillus sp. strain BS8-2]
MTAKRKSYRRAGVEVIDGMNLDAVASRLRMLAEQQVNVGMQGDAELAMIAGVHEYGSAKMKIPARSFIGTGLKKSRATVSKLVRSDIQQVAIGRKTVASFLDEIGQTGLQKTEQNFLRIKKPALSPEYKRTKTGRKLLLREDDLHKSLTYKVVVRPRRGRG